MNCQMCGSGLKNVTTDLPFKRDERNIVIIKNLPILQCAYCGEYLIEDSVMAWIEETLAKISPCAELEIIQYAA